MDYKKLNYLLAISSGFVLSLPWSFGLSGILLFLGFVPLLILEDRLANQKPWFLSLKVYQYSFLSFFIWNVSSTWWIAYASFAGFMMAVLVNSLLFSFIFTLFHLTKKTLGNSWGYLSLIIYWTAWEYIYLNTEISWPWLHLGNAFANDYRWVQWFEYTGVLGGTVWVFLMNFLIFKLWKLWENKNGKRWIYGVGFLLLGGAPIIYSIIKYENIKETGPTCRIILFQPNFQPYQKLVSSIEKTEMLIHLADSTGCEPGEVLLFPEAYFDSGIPEKSFFNRLPFLKLYEYARQKKVVWVGGAITYSEEGNSEIRHNTALSIDSSFEIQKYYKSRLVIGAETTPYITKFKFLNPLIRNFGGSVENYGTQDDRGVFNLNGKSVKVAPVICYESVYGEFMTGFIKNGASVIFIITNDSWWGNTPGYKQHLGYARLRAIETRRSVARAASTGMSGFINQRGDLIDHISWGQQAAIQGLVRINNDMTFYTMNGDFLGKLACFPALFLLILVVAIKSFRKNKEHATSENINCQ